MDLEQVSESCLSAQIGVITVQSLMHTQVLFVRNNRLVDLRISYVNWVVHATALFEKDRCESHYPSAHLCATEDRWRTALFCPETAAASVAGIHLLTTGSPYWQLYLIIGLEIFIRFAIQNRTVKGNRGPWVNYSIPMYGSQQVHVDIQ